jgi:beta-glucanase (GH16 family)
MPYSSDLPSSLAPGAWTLTFDDEFDDPNAPLSVLDGGPFTNAFMTWGDYRTLPANLEQELYVDPSFIPNPSGTNSLNADAPAGSGGTPLGINPFSYDNGDLDITAIPTPSSAVAAGITQPYLSGMISTEYTFTQQYGFFEMRAELPAGQGLWPEFWLYSLPTVPNQEIDVMEALGNNTSVVYQSMHAPSNVQVNPEPVGNYSTSFHTYGVEWSPTNITYFIDGKQTVQIANPFTANSPMYLIANLAVGGSWGGDVNSTTPFPATMQIDYIRAYQNSAWNPSTPVTPPSVTPSANGTEITSASASPIIDQSGNAWTLVQSTSSGLQIAVNGTVDTPTANVVLLETLNGAMVQENAAGNWYSETMPNDSWALIANPNPPPPPPPPATIVTGNGSDTLVLSISEDAYANGDGTSDANGDPAFTVSVDGKQLAGTFYATASHSAGASQNFTLKGDWAPGAHSVTVAFLNDAWGGTASTDRNLYVSDVTYDGTDTKQSAALYSTGSQTFSVTDSTAIPPVVTGGGSDSLMVKVSEDYYLANAQFTVSIDGKQLGGTFTATTLHSSGNSQTFAFAGDFGSGQHTVSVNFLNDAWAGTPATDRNLYVNDIAYNGTDTGQSAALMHQGAKTFSISGGTTPSVSETGNHGSLQENLSQTGSYTVGGDTFVLGAGNIDTVTLSTGTSQIKFVGSSSVTLTGGAGQATVTADAGNNKVVAGSGSLDVAGGAGKDAYVFHSTSGLLTLEDFSLTKGDTLTIDKSLQGSLHEASDGVGGVILSFGTAGHGVDIHGLAALPSSNIAWA